jgi:hypothetical protein
VLCMIFCFDIYFDGFLYFTCGVSDLVGRRIESDNTYFICVVF